MIFRSIALIVGLLLCGTLRATAATVSNLTISPPRDFNYPQTPNFVDQTKPGSNNGIDTVSSLRKKDRLDNQTDHRERFRQRSVNSCTARRTGTRQRLQTAAGPLSRRPLSGRYLQFCRPCRRAGRSHKFCLGYRK